MEADKLNLRPAQGQSVAAPNKSLLTRLVLLSYSRLDFQTDVGRASPSSLPANDRATCDGIFVMQPPGFVDIHCHLLPGMDDGASSWTESLEMAAMACADGVRMIVATTHQLGNFAHNRGDQIRRRAAELQQQLNENRIALQVLPGADVRIEAQMVEQIRRGEVLTLGDHGRHVLLELPHELYFPLEPVLQQLESAGLVGVLSHPERNQGLLREPQLIEPLIQRGCLMQVTAGSLLGGFGDASLGMAEWMVEKGLSHFLSSDGHGVKSRRPLLGRAYHRACELAGEELADAMCRENPAAVALGRDVPQMPRPRSRSSFLQSWIPWRRAA